MAPKKNYSSDQMAQALQLIANGRPVAAVAKQTGIPRTTLLYKSTGKSPQICGMGPPTILTTQEEMFLVQWIILIQKRHFPVTKTMLLDSVEKIITNTKRKSPFKNNRPGDKWFKSFLRRHPEISQRVAQNLTPARENVTERQIRNWFDEVNDHLKSANLLEITKDPRRVFNADESAFYLNPKGNKALAKRGDKNIYSVGGDEKENLTVLLTASAEGQIPPPMIIFTYSRVPSHIAQSIPSSWGIGNSESGWMCSSTFYEYMANIFVPWLDKEKIERPVLFFVDGHKSHLTLHLSNFCSDNGIELIALFPNSTHLLQPLDVAVFRPLKNAWKTEAQKWRSENGGIKLQKQNFGPIFVKALEHLTKTTVKNGFRVSGICPFDVENVKFEKIAEHHATPAPPTFKANYSTELFLEELENRISEEKRVCFESALSEGVWQGEVEDYSLFNLWKDLKLELAGNKDNVAEHNKENIDVDQLGAPAQIVQEVTNGIQLEQEKSPSAISQKIETTPVKDDLGEVKRQDTNLPTPLKNVPSPFKKALFWPGPSTVSKRKRSKEKIPSVVTSKAWREYHTQKENQKKLMVEEKTKRKLQREQKKLERKQKNKTKKDIEDSETSEDEEPEESGDSLDDVDIFESEQDFCDLDNAENVSTGDYVLVRFFGGKRNATHYRYACVIQNMFDDGDIEVMSMKTLNEEKTIFKINDNDISSVNKTAILGKLPPPTMLTSGDRIKYKFVKPVDVYEA